VMACEAIRAAEEIANEQEKEAIPAH